MKSIIVTILTIVCLTLGTTLLIQHTQARKQLEAAKVENVRVIEERNTERARVDEQAKVISQLETNLAQRKDELTAKAGELTAKAGELDKTAADLAKARNDFKMAQAEVQKQASRIADLEGEKDRLTHKMDDLQGSIASLETKIADTKKKLELSEGDRQTLLTQLKHLEAEKASLVAQFNNIRSLRTQLAKLKEEAAIAQRLAWMRSGLYINQEKKGAERLLAETSEKKPKTDGRLNVEIEQNGGAKVTSPKPVN
jgi:chromosome segregation ATPase